MNRRRPQRQPRRHLRHLRIDVDERLARAVDRHFDLLAGRRSAEEKPVGVAVQIEAEHVVAVGGKRVNDGEPAARAERRAVDAPQLRLRLRHAVVRLARRRVGIANRERRHLARRAQIAFHQRRRERLRVGDVVEALADAVGRQERFGVDVERDQIANRARVLGAVQALERAPSRVRLRRGRAIDPRREAVGQRAQRRLVRTPRARRRHHAGAQLPDHLLGDGRLLGRGVDVERRERQTAGLAAVAVADRAGLLDRRRLAIGCLCGGRRRRLWPRRDRQTQKRECGRGQRGFFHVPRL